MRSTGQAVRVDGVHGPPGSAAGEFGALGMQPGAGAPITVEGSP